MLLYVPWFRTCTLAAEFEGMNLSQQQFEEKKRKKENELEVKYRCPYLVQKNSSLCRLSVFVRFLLDLTMQKKIFKLLETL